jgi:hypothetical protein
MDVSRQFRPEGECEMGCTQSHDWEQSFGRFEPAWNKPANVAPRFI